MNIEQQLLKPSHRCRSGGNYKKTSITIHSTGNPSSTVTNEQAWLDNPSNNRDASWHYVVGEDIVIQAIPDIEEAWHCGNTTGNRYSIGVEIVESGNRKKVLETAAKFVASKLRDYNLPNSCVKQHYDWTRLAIQKLVNTGKIADGNKLDLTIDMVRILVIMKR